MAEARRLPRATISRAGCVLLLLFVSVVSAQETAGDDDRVETLGEALREGTFSLALNYRYELVDQDGFDDDAHASTLRTALGYETKPFHGFAIGVEVENVTAVGNDELYDNAGSGSLWNGVTDRPVIADPEITELDQAYLVYHGLRDSRVQAGRIRWVLDNERFVGAVGWRQNHQSFDAVAFDSDRIENWHFHYAWLDRVHTVTGAGQAMSSHLLNVGWDSAVGKVIGYGYLLDYDQPDRFRFSTSTWGARLDGTTPLTPVDLVDLVYVAEYATQSDRGENPFAVDVDYLHALLGVKKSAWGAQVGYELLEGDGTVAFQTPLGTNHKFNGFADKFLVTPPNGLRDLYARLSWTKGAWSAFADYHLFEPDVQSLDYGDELDLQVVYSTSWKQRFAAKAAFYSADRFATDTTKIWLWTSWGF